MGSVSPPSTPNQSPKATYDPVSPSNAPGCGSTDNDNDIEGKLGVGTSDKTGDDLKEYKDLEVETPFLVPSKPIDIDGTKSSMRHKPRPPQRSDSETSSIHMEVDEVIGCADKTTGNTDIDSGIENMEVSCYILGYVDKIIDKVKVQVHVYIENLCLLRNVCG